MFNWIYQVYVISTNVYIAISFINYAKPYGDLYKVDDDSNAPAAIEGATQGENKVRVTAATTDSNNKSSEAFIEKMKPRIAAWISTKRFATVQFTIEDLATVLGTNKYYLSRYIRETYDMNFSTWVASLRLEEAKQMMLVDKDKKLEEIAFAVGFSSLSYFSKVFSRLEGVTPSAWLRTRSL